jgi:hypothetical protein
MAWSPVPSEIDVTGLCRSLSKRLTSLSSPERLPWQVLDRDSRRVLTRTVGEYLSGGDPLSPSRVDPHALNDLHALQFSLQQYASLWPLLGNAHFVARAAVLLMRSVAARVAYADSFGRTFARRMAGSTHHDTARAVHSTRTRAALLAMPSLWYSHGTDLAPDALGSSDRAISFAACSAQVAVVCVFACVFACAGNGARLVVQLADAADALLARRPLLPLAMRLRFPVARHNGAVWPALRAAQRRAPAAAERKVRPFLVPMISVLWSAIHQRALLVHRLARGPSVCTSSATGRGGAHVAIVSAARVAFGLERACAADITRQSCTLAGRGRSDARRAVPLRAPVMCAARPPALPAQRRGRVHRRRAAGSSVAPALGPRVAKRWRGRSGQPGFQTSPPVAVHAAQRGGGRRHAALASPARAAAC